MSYPKVLSEDETIEAARHRSVSRFGDGELRLAYGSSQAISQDYTPALKSELRRILGDPSSKALVCIPNAEAKTPKKAVWDKYTSPSITGLYGAKVYGSSFITRPDSAPWIDRTDYWLKVAALWSGRDILLITGGKNGLKSGELTGSKSVKVIECVDKNAYVYADQYEEQVGTFPGTVIMSAGATATVLAYRLAKKGIHALDLGHLGMFMRHAGIYVDKSTLISPEYEKANRALHADPRGFGGDGKKHRDEVLEFAKEIGATSILDYGCGQGTLKKAIGKDFKGFFGEYDPAITGKDALPKPADLVVCTDVLEHIEPDKLQEVLRHLVKLSAKGCYLVIATRPANKVLPDGRNAHLIIQSADWWKEQLGPLASFNYNLMNVKEKRKGDGSPHEVRIWLRK